MCSCFEFQQSTSLYGPRGLDDRAVGHEFHHLLLSVQSSLFRSSPSTTSSLRHYRSHLYQLAVTARFNTTLVAQSAHPNWTGGRVIFLLTYDDEVTASYVSVDHVFLLQGYKPFPPKQPVILRFGSVVPVSGTYLIDSYTGRVYVATMLVRRGASCIGENAVRNTPTEVKERYQDDTGVDVNLSGASGNFTLCMRFSGSRYD